MGGNESKQEEREYRQQSEEEFIIWKANNARAEFLKAEENEEPMDRYKQDKLNSDLEAERKLLEVRNQNSKAEAERKRAAAEFENSKPFTAETPYKKSSPAYVVYNKGNGDWGAKPEGTRTGLENPWVPEGTRIGLENPWVNKN